MRYGKVSLQIKYLYRENKAFQYFVVVDDKMKKYLLDNRFLLSEYFENFIISNVLSRIDKDFEFVSRRNEDDKVVLEFTFPEGKDIEKRATYYYTLSGDIPYGTGCEECRFYKEELYCEKKEKYLARKLKTCKFFSQKESEN